MQKILTGGYYLVSLDKVDLNSDTISLPNVAKLLYDALKYKFVVFTEIVIDGVERNAIPCEFSASLTYTEQPEDWDEEEDGEFVPQPLYTAKIINLYGLDLDIDAEGGVTVTEHSGGGIDPTSIPEGEITQGGIVGFNEDDKLVKGTLFGKYVRIIDAPASQALTEELYETFKGGVFVKGTFLGYKNPVFCPTYTSGGGGLSQEGIFIGAGIGSNDGPIITTYQITGANHYIQLRRASEIKFSINALMEIAGLIKLNGKGFPSFPNDQANKSYHFVLDNGTLKWHEGNGLYLHTVTFTVSGTSNTMELRFISDSDQMFAHDPQANKFSNPGATFINLANQHNLVITPFGANGLNPVVYGFDTSTGAFTDVITFSGIITETITPIK